MQIKEKCRLDAKFKRRQIGNKCEISKEVSKKLSSLKLYNDCDTILCYASLEDEISTDRIIANALKDGKIVALPYCIDNEGNMEFYLINSLDDLKIGTFGVREPDINKCKKLSPNENALIIVPALCFDKRGYRIGYGKGYYDKYLQNHPLISVGLCYNSLVFNEIPSSEYDAPVNYIITESQIIDCGNGGRNG